MKSNYKRVLKNEIDLDKIISNLWKGKLLILITTLFFAFVGYIYISLQPKMYQATFILRDAPAFVFNKYSKFFSQDEFSNLNNINIIFNQEFKSNLISDENLVNFFQQNKKLDELKSYIKTIQLVTDNNKTENKYKLIYSKPFSVEEFINEYLTYIKQITENKLNDDIIFMIEDKINIIDYNLKIAQEINMREPIMNSIPKFSLLNESLSLFYLGTKVLYNYKLYLLKQVSQVTETTLNYEPILELSNPRVQTSSSIIILISSMLGFFCSITYLIFRDNLKQNNYFKN